MSTHSLTVKSLLFIKLRRLLRSTCRSRVTLRVDSPGFRPGPSRHLPSIAIVLTHGRKVVQSGQAGCTLCSPSVALHNSGL